MTPNKSGLRAPACSFPKVEAGANLLPDEMLNYLMAAYQTNMNFVDFDNDFIFNTVTKFEPGSLAVYGLCGEHASKIGVLRMILMKSVGGQMYAIHDSVNGVYTTTENGILVVSSADQAAVLKSIHQSCMPEAVMIGNKTERFIPLFNRSMQMDRNATLPMLGASIKFRLNGDDDFRLGRVVNVSTLDQNELQTHILEDKGVNRNLYQLERVRLWRPY